MPNTAAPEDDVDSETIASLYAEVTEQTKMLHNTRELILNLAARRRKTVLALREAGQTHKQIAAHMGVTKTAVQNILDGGSR